MGGVALHAYDLPPVGQVAGALALVVMAHVGAVAARSPRPGLRAASGWLVATLAAWHALPVLAPALVLEPLGTPRGPAGGAGWATGALPTSLGSGWCVATAGLALVAVALLASRHRRVSGRRAQRQEVKSGRAARAPRVSGRETVAASLVAGLIVQGGLLATAVRVEGPPPDHPAAILAPPQIPTEPVPAEPAPTEPVPTAPVPTAPEPVGPRAPGPDTANATANAPASVSANAAATAAATASASANAAASASASATATAGPPASARTPGRRPKSPRRPRRRVRRAGHGVTPPRRGLVGLLDQAAGPGGAPMALAEPAGRGAEAAALDRAEATGPDSRALASASLGLAAGGLATSQEAGRDARRGASLPLCAAALQARLRRALAEAAYTCSVPALGGPQAHAATRQARRLWVGWALGADGLPTGDPTLPTTPGLDGETRRCVERALGIARWDASAAPPSRCRLEVSVPVPQRPAEQAGDTRRPHSRSGRS